MAINKSQYEGKSFVDNNGETFIVEKIFDAKCVKVVYPETDTSKIVQLVHVREGRIKNPAHGNTRPTQQVKWLGLKNVNSRRQEFEIIEVKTSKVKVRFKDTGTEKYTTKENFRYGKVMDNMSPSLCGVGYVGFYDKTIPYAQRAYILWSGMISRCYGNNQTVGHDCYVGIEVSNSWKCFANFIADLPSLDGFQQWIDMKDVDLDKDLKSDLVKMYSNKTCCFIDRKLNQNQLKNTKHKDGVWPHV